jgi:hypothetical protein
MASETSGKRPLMPVWKTSGSSSFTRYWLKLKSGPPGTWTGVLMRKIPGAISCRLVPLGSFAHTPPGQAWKGRGPTG